MESCDAPLLGQPNGVRVRFAVDSDESALRIEAVLGSLGFDLRREHTTDDELDLFESAARSTAQLHELTAREREVLLYLLRGYGHEQIAAQLKVRRATIRWHNHNIYAKVGVASRELLLRRALGLDEPHWMRTPRQQRDALERLDLAAREVLAILHNRQADALDEAARTLTEALDEAHAIAPSTSRD